MSLQEDLTAMQRCLDELTRSVSKVEQQVGSSLDIRRVRTDTDHLRDSVALLREAAPAKEQPANSEVIRIPETPYDSSLWTDLDDEGLGARDRHAP